LSACGVPVQKPSHMQSKSGRDRAQIHPPGGSLVQLGLLRLGPRALAPHPRTPFTLATTVQAL
jgi:hypothetical protein